MLPVAQCVHVKGLGGTAVACICLSWATVVLIHPHQPGYDDNCLIIYIILIVNIFSHIKRKKLYVDVLSASCVWMGVSFIDLPAMIC